MILGIPPSGGLFVRTQPTWGFGEARPMVSAASLRARCMKTSSWLCGAFPGMISNFEDIELSIFDARSYPLFRGYFGHKILRFNSLQGVDVCKIFIIRELQLNCFLSKS